MTNKTNHSFLYILLFIPVLLLFGLVYSCTSDDTISPREIDNPNVKTFDSIGVDEFINQQSMNCINLLIGQTVTDSSIYKDVDLSDSNNTGLNFFLQSGDISLNDILPGYSARFYRFYPHLTKEQFDTITRLDAGATLDSVDFTQNDTYGMGAWEYFNAPLTKNPVYGVFLRGKFNSGVTTKPVYAILQPREAADSQPSEPGGYRMSFRVRINTNGENDFRKKIIQ